MTATLGQIFVGGQIQIRVDVIRVDTRAPVFGAAVDLHEIGGAGQTTAGAGFTDAEGTALISIMSLQALPQGWTVKIHPPPESMPGAVQFAPRSQDVYLSSLPPPPPGTGGPLTSPWGGAAQPQQTPPLPSGTLEAFFAVCPKGADPLVCEIGERQLKTAEQLAILNEQWSGPNSFTVDQAHAFLMNLGPGPALAAAMPAPLNWIQDVSWAIMDVAIPLHEWREILQRRAQALRVLAEIPFPVFAGKDWFFRCARGLPVAVGKGGQQFSLQDYRIYSSTYSDYFPRSDRQIRIDLATRYLLDIMLGALGAAPSAILSCLERKVARKLDEVTRSQKAYSLIGTVASFLLGASLGSVTSMVTDVATLAKEQLGADAEESQVIDVAIGVGLTLGGTPGANQKLTGLLSKVLANAGLNLDPVVEQIALSLVSDGVTELLSDYAVETVAGEALAGGSVDFIDLSGIATGVVNFAKDYLVATIKAKGVKRVQDFRKVVLDFQNIEAKMQVFMAWILKVMAFDILLEEVSKEAGLTGLSGDPDADFIEPLRTGAKEEGEPIPESVEAPKTVRGRRIVDVAVGIGVPAGALALSQIIPALVGGGR